MYVKSKTYIGGNSKQGPKGENSLQDLNIFKKKLDDHFFSINTVFCLFKMRNQI